MAHCHDFIHCGQVVWPVENRAGGHMVVQKDTHVLIDLTQLEACLLKDLLRDAKEGAQQRGSAWETLRTNLLYSIPENREGIE